MPALRNPRHENFAHLIVQGEDRTGAFMGAFGCKTGQRASRGGSRIAKRPDVSARINELSALDREKRLAISRQVAQRHNITREYIIGVLRDTIDRCSQAVPVLDSDGSPTGLWTYNSASVIRSAELLGKEIGMFVDRTEIGRPGEFQRLAQMTNEELDAYEADLLRQLGVDEAIRLLAAKDVTPVDSIPPDDKKQD